MTVTKKFRCECSQIKLTFAVFNIITRWVLFRVTFGLYKMKKVFVAWHNKGWTKVRTAEDWKKIKGQVIKQPSPEKNGGFLHHLVIKIEEEQDR